jgi:hypothetical protein
MRALIGLLVIIYLVGVGVVLKQTGVPAPRRNSSRELQRNCRKRWLGRRRHIATLQRSPALQRSAALQSSLKRESGIRPIANWVGRRRHHSGEAPV